MTDDTRRDRVDEMLNDLDELKTSVEELAEDAPAKDHKALKRIRSDLKDALDAADDIEE